MVMFAVAILFCLITLAIAMAPAEKPSYFKDSPTA